LSRFVGSFAGRNLLLARSRVYLAAWVMAMVGPLVVVGCGGDNAASDIGVDDKKPLVMTTTGIWADIVSRVSCGNLVVVESLIPDGADPHGFEGSLRSRGRLAEASLVVANGLGLETNLAGMLDSVEDDGVAVFRVADHLKSGEETLGGDPHIWLDPVLVASVLPALVQQMSAETNVEVDDLERCAAEFDAELASLNDEILAAVSQIPEQGRKLVTNHDALGYFANRYGFEVVGVVIPGTSSLAESNPAQLQELANLIKQQGVPAIFAETQHSTDNIDTLASRVGGVAVIELYTGSLGLPGTGADTYVGMLRANAKLISDGLG